MDILVSYLTRKRTGDVVHRDVEVGNDVIRLGRGADCQVYLHDPRVAFSHAEIHGRAGGLFIEALDPAFELIVNGAPTNVAQLQPDDKIGIGPYEIIVVEAPSGKDLAITVELLEQRVDQLERLKSLSRTSLSEVGISMRGVSWAFFILVIALFLVWPVAYFVAKPGAGTVQETPMEVAQKADRIWPLDPDLAWDSGEISSAHKFMARSCNTCHQQAFVQVEDRACVACHSGIQHHADPVEFALAELAESRCQNCHKEHNGTAPIVPRNDALCANCHGRLKETAPKTALLDATDFGDDHPQFRPTVLVDVSADGWERRALDPADWPVERSYLKFPHKNHLKPEGLRTPGKTSNTVLQCADCHRPERGGVGMQAITMQAQCAECHQLKFEPAAPDRVVPHGDVKAVLLTLKEFYGDMALRGGSSLEDAPASVRRRPGAPFSEAERLEALDWAEHRAAQAAEYVFGKSVCRVCHEVSRTEQGASDGWRVDKVVLADRWMPKGLFDHGRHETMSCVSCHRAPESESAADVLLPGIETCQKCHGGEQAATRVPTTCTACHKFHQPLLGPMRPELVKAAGG